MDRNTETVTIGITGVLFWGLTILFFFLPQNTFTLFVALLCLIVAVGFTVIFIKKLFDDKEDEDIDGDAELIETPASTQRVYAEPVAERPLSRRERIRENSRNAVACCPKCGSTSLSAHKKGFGVGKAFVGAWAIGGLGLVAGNIGAKKVRVTCLNCGKQFWAGKK